jgi:hypothetical protein
MFSNPLNTGIVAVLIAAVVTAVLWFLSKNRVKTKFFSVGGADLSTAIPRIDRHRDEELARYIYESKETVISTLPQAVPRVLRMLLANKIRSPIYYRIKHNSLTKRFSTQVGIREWKALVRSQIVAQMNYIVDYCNMAEDSQEAAYIKSTEFLKLIDGYLADVVDRFVDILITSCYAKIDVYKKSGDKSLIDKNTQYIANMKAAAHPEGV